jgi:predicted Zn-dependent protease
MASKPPPFQAGRGSERDAGGQAEPSEPPHPEAEGFGHRPRRLRLELTVIVLLVVALPFVVVWGARAGAEHVAVRLPASMDERLGRPTWEALRLSPEHCEDAAAQGYVEAVAAPLIAALGPGPFQFRLLVSSSEAVNAFALPGGFLVVNRGLLDEAKSGDEVAGVLAHEMSHVTLRHSTKRLAGGLGTLAALSLMLGVVDVAWPAYTVAHLAGLQYERSQEAEADEHGRALLLRAGISPAGMATFFERLGASLRPPEIVATHPDPGGRAALARRQADGFEARLTLPPPPAVTCP